MMCVSHAARVCLIFVLVCILTSTGFASTTIPPSSTDISAITSATSLGSAAAVKQAKHVGTDGNWLAEIQTKLQQAEYHASQTERGLQAPNRVHNLRSYFSENGLKVIDRTAEQETLLFNMQYRGMARGNGTAQKNLSKVNVTHKENRIELDYGKGLIEWFVNSDLGLEHGFTIQERPAGELPLHFYLDVEHAKVSLLGQKVSLQTNSGRQLNYSKLVVIDATGRQLPSRMDVRNGKTIALVVEDRNAVYPIIVDPLLTGTADTELVSVVPGAELGSSVSGAGDVNADGYADIIVGASLFDNGETSGGVAFIYHGSANGVSTTASIQLNTELSSAEFGVSVSSAGDVNGDGYDDVIVGAHKFKNVFASEGGAFVFHGSEEGINATYSTAVYSGQASANLGWSVSGAGDVNGDGYADIIVGAYRYDNVENQEGAVFIYHGSAEGIIDEIKIQLESNQVSAEFGWSVAGAGDLNSDGYADVIVGAPAYDNVENDEGVVFVYYGSAAGISEADSTLLEIDQDNANFGVSVAGAGDVNGDGYADAIVGAELFNNGESNEGAAFIFYGSENGVAVSVSAQLESNQSSANLGISVAGAGDVNGDGYADVIVGATGYDGSGDSAESNEGSMFVYHGSANGINVNFSSQFESNQATARLGVSVASAGDVNGDGYADVIVGAHEYDNGETNSKEGRAFIFHGSADGITTNISSQLESDQTNAYLGFSVAGAGDVNGDGYTDVIVGAYKYDNGENNEGAAFVYHGSGNGISTTVITLLESNQNNANFGFSVSGTGDVNGDGYADVVVGANTYDNAETDEGAAFVYYGSGEGINADNSTQLESNQVNANFASSVSRAGDVNGDGYADIIIGASMYDNGDDNEGAAFVYHGSADGLNSNAATVLDSNQINANFGISVAGAGDVNGDGFSDVVIGANSYDKDEIDEGNAFIYHGSASGISVNVSTQLEPNQDSASFGQSVAGVGDVNGDGYSDVIIGAPFYDEGEVDEGAAFVYHGSANGIISLASSALMSNQVNANFGNSVAGAGDVNGDGYADVIVGAYLYDNGETDEGAAFVYQGSASGVSASASVLLESNQASANFGVSVASAGDVNGDGFGDVIVGAEKYDSGESDEGTAFVYLGNSDGRLIAPRQYDAATITNPVAAMGISAKADSFDVKMQVYSPSGRVRVKLQTQVCETGVAFDDASCKNFISNDWVDVGISGSLDFTQNITGLDKGALYHWRARALYTPFTTMKSSVNPAHGPWRSFQGKATNGNIRTLNVSPALGGTFTTAGVFDDNAALAPFSGVTVADSDGDNVSIAITYTAANGTLTGTGLTGSAGNYTLSSTDVTTATSQLQALLFTPIENQVALGSTVTTTFTLAPNDGLSNGPPNATTQITVTSVRASPVVVPPADITLNATGLFTEVELNTAAATATSTDGVVLTPQLIQRVSNGGVPESLGGIPAYFSPGVHLLTWAAVDGDLTGSAIQTVNVIPMVNFSVSQNAVEGSSAIIKIILNGPAVSYPVSVPYTVAGTALSNDHDLVAGVFTIESPDREATLTVNFVDDGIDDSGEALVVAIDQTNLPTNAVKGLASSQTINIFEGNVAANVSLVANQRNVKTRLIGKSDGVVTVSAVVVDANRSDTHSYDWQNTDNALVDTDSEDNTFTFNPSGMTAGTYVLKVAVNDGTVTANAELALKIETTLPALSATDSDKDGINDDIEGGGDSDGDGIPNYLDYASFGTNVVQAKQDDTTAYLIETEPGLTLTLGDVAFRMDGVRAGVTAPEIRDHANNGTGAVSDKSYAYDGGLFSFNIDELPIAGQKINVVIPQFSAIPEGAVYRKLMTTGWQTGWQDFVEDANNRVFSAPGAEGYCPPPGDSTYVAGLVVGSWCVQLTIEDGGENDSDGLANNRVKGPGGVAKALPASNGGGGGVISFWFLGLMCLLIVYRVRETKTCHLR